MLSFVTGYFYSAQHFQYSFMLKHVSVVHFFFFKDFIYVLLERGEASKKDKERNIDVWLPLMWPL